MQYFFFFSLPFRLLKTLLSSGFLRAARSCPLHTFCAIPGSDITDNRFVQRLNCDALLIFHHPFSIREKRAIPETNRVQKYHTPLISVASYVACLAPAEMVHYDGFLPVMQACLFNETAARNIPSSPGSTCLGYRPARKSEKRQGLKDTTPIPSRSEISDNRQVDPCQLWVGPLGGCSHSLSFVRNVGGCGKDPLTLAG